MAWNLDFISEEDFKKHVRATIMKYGEKLESTIPNTTREQREQIVKDSLGYSELGCDDAMDGYDMYLPYIEGIKELREITMEYQAQYVRDMEREERGRCNLY